MKKLVILLLTAVMCIGMFAGCGKKESGTAAKDDSKPGMEQGTSNGDPLTGWIVDKDTSKAGTVRFWIPFKGEQGMDDMIAEFNKTYPNIKVELNTYNNNADGNIALNTSIMAGECDVVASFEIANLVTREENGLYQDITDKVKSEGIDLIKNWGTENYNYNGKTYALPCGGLTHYVAINMTAWNKAGLGDLPTEWTWDEYIDACKKMTEYNADGTTKVYGGSNYQVITDLLDCVYQVNGCNRLYNSDGTCSFNSDMVKKQIAKYIQAEKDGVWFKLDTYRSDNDKTWFAYTDGRINSSVSCNLARFLRDTTNYPVDFVTGIAPYPTVEKGQKNNESGVNYFSFAGITQGCKDEDAAWAFVKWYSTYGSKYLTIAGHQSTWRGTDSSQLVSLIFGSEEEAAKIVDVDSFKKWVGNPENPSSYDDNTTAYSEIVKIWNEYVMYAYTGEKTIDDALDTAAKLANEAIKKAK